MDTNISYIYITRLNTTGLWHKKNYIFTYITMLSNKNIKRERIVLKGPSRDAIEMPPLQIVRLLVSLM